MLKIFYLFFISLFLLSCSGFELVYGEKKSIAALKNDTSLKVSGDNSSLITSALKRKIGSTNKVARLNLEVSSIKNKRKAVTEKDQITSQYEIKYSIDYLLTKNDSVCFVARFSSIVKSNYSSKSSGYSYGSDVGEKKTEKDLIEMSINEFFNHVLFNNSALECKNES